MLEKIENGNFKLIARKKETGELPKYSILVARYKMNSNYSKYYDVTVVLNNGERAILLILAYNKEQAYCLALSRHYVKKVLYILPSFYKKVKRRF